MTDRDDLSRYPLEDRRLDADRAFTNAARYHGELKEIHRYFTPYRTPTVERAGDKGAQTEGAARSTQLFDGTGPASAAAFVSNMKSDWMPAFEDFFKLQNGPLFQGNDKEARAEALQAVGRVVHDFTSKIRATTTEEMFSDLFAGTGAMVLSKGTDRMPIRGFAVPTLEVALENGPWGDPERWIWKRKWKARDIPRMWPRAKIGDKLAQVIKSDRNADVLVTQMTYWDDAAGDFRLSVWTDKDPENELWGETTKASPWITPRMFVVPGEAMGRGLAHIGLPFVKTVNKARELALRAAAFALLGLWVRRNDGVFNPQTATLEPGRMWKVANVSGPLKSIERLDIPHNFDISTVIINDEREQIRRVLLDDELPDITDSVRSPTEIAGRMRRYERNRGGATTRLAFELVVPFVQRAVDILGEHRLLPGDLQVDAILTQAVVTAPAAASQKTDKVDRMVSYLQIVAGLVGPQMMALTTKIEEILPEMARDLGIEERFIRKKAETKQLKHLIDQAVGQALEAQKAAADGAAPQAPEVAPEAEAYINGGF